MFFSGKVSCFATHRFNSQKSALLKTIFCLLNPNALQKFVCEQSGEQKEKMHD